MAPNYRLVAIQVGDLVKWNSSVNEINRAASAILRIAKDSYPNESITSVRAQVVHDWILSLAQATMDVGERDQRLVQFCRAIVTSDQNEALDGILRDAGVGPSVVDQGRRTAFEARHFHAGVVGH